ncbi:hypothetical protein R4198_12225 [Williamsia muralis]|uniref:Uncharacterized protein n=1 Tax=Williamsia marianensis TaxID=85044 RepID=A0ABU4ET94_WILMA|nr:hypothetical protein [Williamsia muralis]MDV7134465.1 hypothetical protein [Williamsia muralis]
MTATGELVGFPEQALPRRVGGEFTRQFGVDHAVSVDGGDLPGQPGQRGCVGVDFDHRLGWCRYGFAVLLGALVAFAGAVEVRVSAHNGDKCVGPSLAGLPTVAGADRARDRVDPRVKFGGFGRGDGRGDVGEAVEVAGGAVVAVRFHRLASFCCSVGVGSNHHPVQFVAQYGSRESLLRNYYGFIFELCHQFITQGLECCDDLAYMSEPDVSFSERRTCLMESIA